MQRITFTKALAIKEKLWPLMSRPGVKGYLFLHLNHPGREFVIGRGTITKTETRTERDSTAEVRKVTTVTGWKYSKTWHLFDRKTGFNLRSKEVYATMAQAVEKATVYLATTTPEQLQECIDATHVKRLQKIIAIS